jgi:hypothetical protein
MIRPLRALGAALILALALGLGACSDDTYQGGGSDSGSDEGVLDDGGDGADTGDPSDLDDPDLARPDADDPDLGQDADPDGTPDADAEDAPEDIGPECAAEETECRGNQAFLCEDGRWVEGACPDGSECVGGECQELICSPNSARCVDNENIGICSFDGTSEETFPCPDMTFCEDAQCQALCEPGTRSCVGDDVVECDEDGRTQNTVDTCSPVDGLACEDGECISSCDAFDQKGGYIGCNYWGVDTPNQFGTRNVFAYVVSNVAPNLTAHVVVSDRDGTIILEQDVEPLGVATLRMPHPRTMNVNNTGISDFGFRIETDVPITAYQFNPLQRFDNDGPSVASNDASLMLPDSALGTRYIGAAFTQWGSYSSYLSIVSTADDNEVVVTPSSATSGGDGVPALAAGQEGTFTVNRGQILTLKSLSAGGDLTGTVIEATENVAVYGGVDCAQVPVGASYCDHIEEKIFPVHSWDTSYFATKFQPRGIETDIWRVIASEDQTVVQTNPPQIDIPVLDEGEFFEFTSLQDFEITSDKPVLVVQFMTGSSTTRSPDDGDPAMLQTVPARQFRRDYIFLVPDTYDRDWMTVTYPTGTQILLDDAVLDLAAGTPIGGTGFSVLRTRVADGRHSVQADAPVGVSVYGYDFNISYAYPAGLDLSEFGQE